MEKNISERDFSRIINEYFNSIRCYSNQFPKSTGLLTLDEISQLLEGMDKDYESFRLFSWNIDWNKRKPNDLLEEKFNLIKKFEPDIVVLQECKYYDCLRLKNEFKYFHWYGDGRDSDLGIGIFSDIWNIELSSSHSYITPFRYVVPYLLSKGDIKISIFSIWTKDKIHKELSDGKIYVDEFYNLEYVNNILSAIDYYKKLLKRHVILIGDFNSADTEKNRYLAHSNLLKKLETYKIFNCTKLPKYKYSNDFEFLPTFFMNYELNKGVVDDYCFISQDNNYSNNITNISVGIPEKWIKKYSDHVPLMIRIMIKKNKSPTSYNKR